MVIDVRRDGESEVQSQLHIASLSIYISTYVSDCKHTSPVLGSSGRKGIAKRASTYHVLEEGLSFVSSAT